MNAITLQPLHLNELSALMAAAEADGHVLIHPTHVVRKNGDIVGYASLARVRMMFAWLDTHKLKGPESFRAWRLAQEEIRQMQAQSGNQWPVALPCSFDSPLLPFVERMGYLGIGDCRLHLMER